MVPSLTEPPLHIAELPPEILLKIFAFLPTQDLLLTVARVSKAFNELVKDAEAHKSVAFTGLVKIDKLFCFLEDKPNIEEFRLIGAPGMQSSPVNLNFPLFVSVFSEMKNLRVFEVDDNWELLPMSLDILSENAHLNRVVANFRQDYFPTIVWQNPKSIKHLEINGDQSNPYIVDIFGTVEKLERLRSNNCDYTSSEMKRIFQRNKETLKEVNLPYYDCSKNDIEALALSKIGDLEPRYLFGTRMFETAHLEVGQSKNFEDSLRAVKNSGLQMQEPEEFEPDVHRAVNYSRLQMFSCKLQEPEEFESDVPRSSLR